MKKEKKEVPSASGKPVEPKKETGRITIAFYGTSFSTKFEGEIEEYAMIAACEFIKSDIIDKMKNRGGSK